MLKKWINNSHTRFKKLTAMGVGKKLACGLAASRKGPWVLSNAKPLKVATPNRFFAEMGLMCLQKRYEFLAKIT